MPGIPAPRIQSQGQPVKASYLFADLDLLHQLFLLFFVFFFLYFRSSLRSRLLLFFLQKEIYSYQEQKRMEKHQPAPPTLLTLFTLLRLLSIFSISASTPLRSRSENNPICKVRQSFRELIILLLSYFNVPAVNKGALKSFLTV